MNKRIAFPMALALTVCLTATIGCGDPALDPGTTDATPTTAKPDGGAPADGAGKDAVPAPAGRPWVGQYQAQGVWDLSGPISAQRSVGAVVAEMLVDEIVTRAGVPGLLADRAKVVVSDLISAKVTALVDANAPDQLKPDSELIKRLSVVLASTEVESTIELGAGTLLSDVKGREDLRTFTFTHQGRKTTVPVNQVLQLIPPQVTLSADWRGDEGADAVLTIFPHDFALRLGKLVVWVTEHVLGESGAQGYAQAAASAVNCTVIPALILDGKDSLTFGVSGASYSIAPAMLQAGCGRAADMVKDRALGLFDVETGVRLGGKVQWADDSGDRRADRLTSKPGYGGPATATGGVLAPQIAARFAANRR